MNTFDNTVRMLDSTSLKLIDALVADYRSCILLFPPALLRNSHETIVHRRNQLWSHKIH